MSSPTTPLVDAPVIPQKNEELQKYADDYDTNKWLHIYERPGEPAYCGFIPKGGTCAKPGCPNTIIKLEYCPVCGIKTCHFCLYAYKEAKKNK